MAKAFLGARTKELRRYCCREQAIWMQQAAIAAGPLVAFHSAPPSTTKGEYGSVPTPMVYIWLTTANAGAFSPVKGAVRRSIVSSLTHKEAFGSAPRIRPFALRMSTINDIRWRRRQR